jgi:hypothetical protein
MVSTLFEAQQVEDLAHLWLWRRVDDALTTRLDGSLDVAQRPSAA